MPNWAEGNIRIRGKRKNIIEFLRNELCYVTTDEKGELTDHPVTLEEKCGGWTIIIKRPIESHGNFYFRGSCRQFLMISELDFGIELSEGPDENKDQIIFIEDFNGAWHVDDEIFKQYAEKYRIDIRIFVWEQGLCWSECVTFYKTGKQDVEYRHYEDWLWDCPLPHYGG